MPDSILSFGAANVSQGRIFFRGAWSSVVSYSINDAVSFGGASYIAIAGSLNVAPTITTSWSQMTAAGGVSSVASKVGAVTLVGADISDHDAALGVPLLDASAFIKAAQQNTTVNSQVGTAYTLVAADRGKLLTLNNAAAIALTVPAASGSFAAGFFVEITSLGAGVVTITPTGTIDGAASLTLSQFQSITLSSVGGNWVCLRTKPLILAADLPGGTTGSGAVVLATSPTITGTAALANVTLNGANTGAGAALTIGGTTTTTGGISVFVGASGAQNERLSIVPADGSTAAVRVGALSVRTISGGFLTGLQVAGISSTGVLSISTATGTLPATVANDTAGGIVFTNNAGGSIQFGNGGTLFLNQPQGIRWTGATSGNTVVQAAAVAGAGTLTLPGGVTDTLVGKTTTDTLSNKTLAGTTPFNRLRANQGTAVVAGDFVITGLGLGSWGTTASITAVSGTDTAGSITISCSGTGQSTNPAIRLTFHDGAFAAAPFVQVTRGDGNSPNVPAIFFGTSTTTMSFGLNGVPVAGVSYIFSWFTAGQ